jgi:hypothetical protein
MRRQNCCDYSIIGAKNIYDIIIYTCWSFNV